MDDQGAEILLSKYLSHFVKRSCQAVRLANHVASRSSKHYQIITKILSVTGFGMLLNLTSHYLVLIFIFFRQVIYGAFNKFNYGPSKKPSVFTKYGLV